MNRNNMLILDVDDTDIEYINNELARDALLLMGGTRYYVTMHSEAAHSTLTPFTAIHIKNFSALIHKLDH